MKGRILGAIVGVVAGAVVLFGIPLGAAVARLWRVSRLLPVPAHALPV